MHSVKKYKLLLTLRHIFVKINLSYWWIFKRIGFRTAGGCQPPYTTERATQGASEPLAFRGHARQWSGFARFMLSVSCRLKG